MAFGLFVLRQGLSPYWSQNSCVAKMSFELGSCLLPFLVEMRVLCMRGRSNVVYMRWLMYVVSYLLLITCVTLDKLLNPVLQFYKTRTTGWQVTVGAVVHSSHFAVEGVQMICLGFHCKRVETKIHRSYF